MKAIVVRQPWASLIALGVKTIETRPGPPNGPMRPKWEGDGMFTDSVRGLPGCRLERGERIAIVAGAAPPKVGLRLGVDAEITFSEYVVGERSRLLDLCNERAYHLPLGAVVCTVVVADALPIVPRVVSSTGPAEWNGHRRFFSAPHEGYLTTTGAGAELPRYTDQLPLGDFTPGRWGWMLTDPEPCDPIPCKGRQGVFELTPDVAGVMR